MENIKFGLSEYSAKKIFGNIQNALLYLKYFNENNTIPELQNIRSSTKSSVIWNIVIKYWDYEKSKNIIRSIFKNSDKYKRGLESENAIQDLINEWKDLNLGPIEWPCSQGQFDDFVQRINSLSESGKVKDEKVKDAAVKYRRLKEINTVRNDYLETLIFEKNENIIPTLNHSRGVDFYIDGISFDQKVAKSPTNEFKRDYGENWRQYALNNPLKVAEYLYTYQDEGRFGADPRLFIVYLDEDIPVLDLKNKINAIDITKPLKVSFKFKHKSLGVRFYTTICFVILLSK